MFLPKIRRSTFIDHIIWFSLLKFTSSYIFFLRPTGIDDNNIDSNHDTAHSLFIPKMALLWMASTKWPAIYCSSISIKILTIIIMTTKWLYSLKSMPFFCHSIYSNIIIIAMFRIMLDDWIDILYGRMGNIACWRSINTIENRWTAIFISSRLNVWKWCQDHIDTLKLRDLNAIDVNKGSFIALIAMWLRSPQIACAVSNFLVQAGGG